MPGFLAGAGKWLADNALGILGVGGAVRQNRAADRQARREMAFAERMSSTAAQRAVADYRAAGLNPALAYDRPASSPGGTSAPVTDEIQAGIHSGLAARQARAQIALTEAQTNKVDSEAELLKHDVGLRQTTVNGEPSWREEQIAKRVATLRDLAHQGRLQPHDERLRAVAVQLSKASLQRSGMIGDLFSDAAALRDFIKAGTSRGAEAAEAFKAWSEAERAAERAHASGVRSKLFNPQHRKRRP